MQQIKFGGAKRGAPGLAGVSLPKLLLMLHGSHIALVCLYNEAALALSGQSSSEHIIHLTAGRALIPSSYQSLPLGIRVVLV